MHVAIGENGAWSSLLPHDLCHTFVDDDACAVHSGRGIKVPSAEECHVHGREIFRAYCIRVDGDLAVGVFTLPAEVAAGAVDMQRIVQAHRRIFDIACGEELVLEGLEVILHVTVEVHIDKVVAGIAQIAVLDVLHLLIDDDGADDEGDGGGELRNDESFPDGDGATAGLYSHALEYIDRIERGEIEGGIAAGEETGDDDNGE
jgi:hypothetical protein